MASIYMQDLNNVCARLVHNLCQVVHNWGSNIIILHLICNHTKLHLANLIPPLIEYNIEHIKETKLIVLDFSCLTFLGTISPYNA